MPFPISPITTDLIVGFPGETLEDVEETIDVVRKVQFDNALRYLFAEGGHPCRGNGNQVPEEIVHEGFDSFLPWCRRRESAPRFGRKGDGGSREEVNEQGSGACHRAAWK